MARRAPSLSSRLSRSRQALAAFLLLSGSAMTVMARPASAHDHALDWTDVSVAAAESQLHQAADPAGSADDWLSEDCWSYADCFAGSCSESISPPLVMGAATPPANEPLVNSQRLDRDLSDLTCEEPVDVAAGMRRQRRRAEPSGQLSKTGVARTDDLEGDQPADLAVAGEIALATGATAQAVESLATEPPKFGPAGLVGGSPVIATLSESYLPYDLSPEDAIAMRMYPIAYPQSSYLGARRTGVYAPIDGLAGGIQWRERTEPAVTLRTEELARTSPRSAQQQQADQQLAALVIVAIEAVQPDSDARAWLRPQRLAAGLGEWVCRGHQAADAAVGGAAVRLAAAWKPAPRRRGVKLDADAAPQVPPSASRETASPILPTDQGRVLRVELACQTAIDVVLAQAARSLETVQPPAETATALQTVTSTAAAEASGRGDARVTAAAAPEAVGLDRPQRSEIARAEAVATACDQAAASLEKLAMALRRAGDMLVRQAKTSADNATLLR